MKRVTMEMRDNIAIVRFSNPPHGYMDEGTESELAALLDHIEAADAIRAVIMTGGDADVFIRHYDVGLLLERGRKLAARGYRFDPARPVPEAPIHSCLHRIATMPKPFVAAINGTAMGGGFELALVCDIRIVLDGDYDLGLPEINLGILPGAGGTQRMTRLIGEARALELMLLGETIRPRDAVRLGLASLLVTDDVVEKAMEIAKRLATRSPRAIAHIKDLVRGAAERPPSESYARERTLFCDLMVSDAALHEMAEMVAGRRDIRARDARV